jgi:hypothetical protein
MDKLKLFVIWLDGYMQACGPVLNEEQTKAVKDKLNGLFEHEADKLEEPKLNLEDLGEQNGWPHHNLRPSNDDGIVYRC